MTAMGNWYYDKLDRYLTMKLTRNEVLLSYLLETPQAFTIPVKDSKKRAVVIWLVLKPETHLSLKLLTYIIGLAVCVIKDSIFLKGLVGIDIVPGFRLENQTIDRILRASIWAGNYNKWGLLKPLDLLNIKQAEGIQCGWYWDPSKISIEEMEAN